MIEQTRTLLQEAMALPEDERADLVAELLASLGADSDDMPPISEAWRDELQRRVDRIASGQDEGRPWEDVLSDLRARLTSPR